MNIGLLNQSAILSENLRLRQELQAAEEQIARLSANGNLRELEKVHRALTMLAGLVSKDAGFLLYQSAALVADALKAERDYRG